MGRMDSVKAYLYRPAANLHVEGEDAADFLQSQFSNDLRPFRAGACTYGLWLDVKGKVRADAWVLQLGEESFRIVSEHCRAKEIREHLEHHIVADDVDISEGDPLYGLSLFGSGAPEALQLPGLLPPEAGHFCEGECVFAFPGRRSADSGYELLFSGEDGLSGARDQFEQAGIEFVSENRIQSERLDAGVPAVPVELGPEDLPGEAAMVGDAVSLSKGCFLGQEVVARMHNVGRARRGLFIFSGTGPVPSVPAGITDATGAAAGILRSVYSLSSGGWQGVVMLKLKALESTSAFSLNGNPVTMLRPMRVVGSDA